MNRRVVAAALGLALAAVLTTASVAAFAAQDNGKAGVTLGVRDQTKADTTPGTEHYAAAGFRLRPADAAALKAATTSATDAITAADGPARSELTADPTAELKYYSNDVAGDIQADGSVKLVYQNVLAWVVTSKLASPPVPHAFAGRDADVVKAPAGTQCYEKAFVDAETGKWLNSISDCEVPLVPVP